MPSGPRTPFPVAPDLPPDLEPAPPALESGDAWDGVRAGADVEVGEAVFDAQLRATIWTDAQLVGRRLAGLTGADVRFVRGDLAGLVIEDCELTRVVFESCRLSGAIFAGATLQEVEFVDCIASRADFRMASLRRAAASGTNLREADFYGSRLTDVRFSSCDLSGAGFQTARPERLDLRGSTVEGLRGVDSLGETRIDEGQVLPLGAALIGALGFRIG